MTNRERALAVLTYAPYDRLPLLHFGFWQETLQAWQEQGHLTPEEASGWADGNPYDRSISAKLGFDGNWYNCFAPNTGLEPVFAERVVETREDGTSLVVNLDGVIVLQKEGVRSIPAEVDHLLQDRDSWQRHYLPRLQDAAARVDLTALAAVPKAEDRETPLGLHCGSLLGKIRDWCGVVGLSYLMADDQALVEEMIATVGELCYRVTSQVLASGVTFDFGHFWEDVCFKSGPLVNPAFFERQIGPQYARLTELLRHHGIDIVSVDCDGKIDRLLPTWLHHGVNTMFPIEVGTWDASIQPWREQYGRALRGVGGMNKLAFARDRAAIDSEVERLRPLVALGGYIPCPDHRIAPDAIWDNVRYYCERMRAVFG
jgi:hypothetical protein